MFCLLAQHNFYGIFTVPVVAILTPLFIGVVTRQNRKVAAKQSKDADESEFVVRYNALTVGTMIFLVILSALVSLVFPITYVCNVPDRPPLGVTIGVCCVCGVGSLVTMFCLLAVRRWAIKVNEDKICHIPMFGKPREYLWDDIVGVNQSRKVYGADRLYLVYVNGREKPAFKFHPAMKCGALFANKLKQRVLYKFQ